MLDAPIVKQPVGRYIVVHVQVEPSVAIDVHKRRGKASTAWVVDAELDRDVLKHRVSLVAIKTVTNRIERVWIQCERHGRRAHHRGRNLMRREVDSGVVDMGWHYKP